MSCVTVSLCQDILTFTAQTCQPGAGSVEMLPPSTWRRVFSFLAVSDLKNVVLVSRYWRAAGQLGPALASPDWAWVLQARSPAWPGGGWLWGAGLSSCSASNISSPPERSQTSRLWTSPPSSWRHSSWASCVSSAVEIPGLPVWTSVIRRAGKWPLEKSFNLWNPDICRVGPRPALLGSLHSLHVTTEVLRLEI